MDKGQSGGIRRERGEEKRLGRVDGKEATGGREGGRGVLCVVGLFQFLVFLTTCRGGHVRREENSIGSGSLNCVILCRQKMQTPLRHLWPVRSAQVPRSVGPSRSTCLSIYLSQPTASVSVCLSACLAVFACLSLVPPASLSLSLVAVPVWPGLGATSQQASSAPALPLLLLLLRFPRLVPLLC